MVWPILLLKRKRNPEKDLNLFVESLRQALAQQLKSVLLFGSYVRGGFSAKHSNLNVLVIADLSAPSLEKMQPAVRQWLRRGYGTPVLVAPDDLDDFARDFPVEFLDILQHRKVLLGQDPTVGLRVDTRHLESQIEHDLALAQLKLRQALVAGHVTDGLLKKVQSSLYVLMDAASMLEKEDATVVAKIKADFQAKGAPHAGAEAILAVMQQMLDHLRKK